MDFHDLVTQHANLIAKDHSSRKAKRGNVMPPSSGLMSGGIFASPAQKTAAKSNHVLDGWYQKIMNWEG